MSRRLTDSDRYIWNRVARTVRAAPGRSFLQTEAPDAETGSAPPAGAKGWKTSPSPREPASPPYPSLIPQPPADVSGERRVRRGQVDIDARIDLHGFTQDTAKSELTAFLRREHASGARCVLVITGKGRAGTGVIRARLQDWLIDPEVRPLIAGQSRAHIRHGGEGAVYVLLKQRRTRLSHD